MDKNNLIWIYNICTVGVMVLIVSLMSQMLVEYSILVWPDYSSMQTLSSPIEWIRWVLGDISEAQFYKSELASLGLLIGASIAYIATRYKQRWAGFELSYATGLFAWIMLSSSLGLILSNLLWGWVVPETQQWQPTFVAFVSLPAAVVLMYGRGMKIAIVGAVLATVLVTPSSLLLVNYVCMPFKIPNIVGNVTGMALGSLVAFWFLQKFPILLRPSTMDQPAVAVLEDLSIKPTATNINMSLNMQNYGPLWTIRRMLADFSESQFIANELAGLGYLLGVFLAIYFNPLSIAYGSALISKILISQVLSSGIALLLWRKQWAVYGWYPTYIPISSVAPAAVLVYQGSILSILLGAILGAVIAPPLARFISLRLAHYQHAYIGNVLSMAITTLLAIGVIAGISSLV